MKTLGLDRLKKWFEVDSPEKCWPWTGRITDRGYGKVRMKENGIEKDRRAHLVVYELMIGRVPAGLELDHLCRVRNCVNPAHLEPVNHVENLRRGRERAMMDLLTLSF